MKRPIFFALSAFLTHSFFNSAEAKNVYTADFAVKISYTTFSTGTHKFARAVGQIRVTDDGQMCKILYMKKPGMFESITEVAKSVGWADCKVTSIRNDNLGYSLDYHATIFHNRLDVSVPTEAFIKAISEKSSVQADLVASLPKDFVIEGLRMTEHDQTGFLSGGSATSSWSDTKQVHVSGKKDVSFHYRTRIYKPKKQ